MVGNNKTLQAEIDESGEIYKDSRQDRAYCANMKCMKPWKQGVEVNPLKACTRCKFTIAL
jgi:hypothetical protein